jgi:hypothetical protein
MEGAVLLTKRFWWQVYKRGWHKHTDLWGGLWWIKYKWNKEQEQFINKRKLVNYITVMVLHILDSLQVLDRI